MSCLTEAFDDTFAVFADVLRNPAFSEDKLEVAKVQSSAGIARRNDSIGGITRREFRRLIYGESSPLSRLEQYDTVAAIGRDDLVAFHANYYHPNNILLGMVGDFDIDEMKDKIADAFRDWERGPEIELPAVEYRKEPNTGVYFVEKGDVNQAHIRMGHLGIERDDPDYFAVTVLNEILGGGFSGRLMQNVRSNQGLAYSVFGGVGASFDHPGVFQVGLQTKSETMGKAVDALKAEIAGIIDNPPSAEELARAKESFLNSFVFRHDSKSEILSQQMTYKYHGLPVDYLEQTRNNIENVTTEDVARVAKKHIHPDRLTLLVVGKAADFDRPVSEFGSVTAVDISIPAPPVTEQAVIKTAATLEAGAQILSAMANALGGPNPASLTAVRRKGKVQVSMGGQSMELGADQLVVFPDKLRLALKTPMGDMTTVVADGAGFRLMAGRVQELASDDLHDAAEQIARDLVYIVKYQDADDTEAVAVGEEEIDGVSCRVVSVTLNGAESRMWVAPDGRVLKQSWQGKHPMQGIPGKVEVTYSDYREVDGMQISYAQVLLFEGQEVMRTIFESVDLNPEIDEASFEKPEA
jgi:predicted Zn-dependent peptidase